MGYYTIPVGFSFFRHFWALFFNFLNYFLWLRITDEGLIYEMRIWSILLMKPDLKWCMHLSISPYLYIVYYGKLYFKTESFPTWKVFFLQNLSLLTFLLGFRYWEKKEEMWLSPMTKDPTQTEKSKKRRDNTKTQPKTSITKWLRTDLGRSVGVTIAIQLVWLEKSKKQRDNLFILLLIYELEYQ